jgi:hypothetical protein
VVQQRARQLYLSVVRAPFALPAPQPHHHAAQRGGNGVVVARGYSFGRLRPRWQLLLFLLVLATMMVSYGDDGSIIRALEQAEVTNTCALMLGAWFSSRVTSSCCISSCSIPYDLDDTRPHRRLHQQLDLQAHHLPRQTGLAANNTIFTFVGNWNDFLGPPST